MGEARWKLTSVEPYGTACGSRTKGWWRVHHCARRFFEAGHVSWVHVYGNIITASLEAGASQAGLNEIVRDLYQYWKPGMVPPTLEELLASMPAEVAPAASSGGDTPAPAGEDPRIPPHLFERSRSARARLTAA
jgi:hypothetical protein